MSTILAIDTSGPHCGVALLAGETVWATRTEAMTKGQAERLFPLISEVLGDCNIDYSELSAIAVATGPGNFTGVRICVSAARGLALSLGIPAVGVSALEALAYGQKGRSLAVLDARADHLYLQSFVDGSPVSEPVHTKFEDTANSVSDHDIVVGFEAVEIARLIGAKRSSEKFPSPQTYGHIALLRNWDTEPRPAPLYLRNADASLPSEPAPVIVP